MLWRHENVSTELCLVNDVIRMFQQNFALLMTSFECFNKTLPCQKRHESESSFCLRADSDRLLDTQHWTSTLMFELQFNFNIVNFTQCWKDMSMLKHYKKSYQFIINISFQHWSKLSKFKIGFELKHQCRNSMLRV